MGHDGALRPTKLYLFPILARNLRIERLSESQGHDRSVIVCIGRFAQLAIATEGQAGMRVDLSFQKVICFC